MKKSLIEQNGITYHHYLIPNLVPPETIQVGIWGQRRRKYLRERKEPIFTAWLLGGKLDSHLMEIDRQAEELFSRLVQQMMEREGITEQLKAENQLAWVGRMNSIRNAAEEIVFSELIYA
jgi:hypothetical protein